MIKGLAGLIPKFASPTPPKRLRPKSACTGILNRAGPSASRAQFPLNALALHPFEQITRKEHQIAD
jgi:hypothetical protein